jgi:hypothetical protein
MGSCASTQLVDSWSSKGALVDSIAPARGVLVLALVRSDPVRRLTEDSFMTSLSEQGIRGVPSYRILGTVDPAMEVSADVERRIKASGVDAVLVVQYMEGETRVTTSRRPRNPTYAFIGWQFDPEVRVDRISRLQADLYGIRSDLVQWSGTSETFNPATHQKLIRSVADAMVRDWKRRGTIVRLANAGADTQIDRRSCGTPPR